MNSDPSIIARPLTRDQAREVDQRAVQEYGLSGLVLMENAGRGVAEWIIAHCPRGTAGILCGRGNNAGDGYVIARHLELAGWPVRLIQLADPEGLRGDALANWEIAQRARIPTDLCWDQPPRDHLERSIARCDLLVDCMLGTGASGDPRPPLADAIHIANSRDVPRIAVDTPSGLDCQTARVGSPSFRAHHTCTMVAPKIGMTTPEAREVVGEIHVICIGVPRALLESLKD